jgi:hypothetical protein
MYISTAVVLHGFIFSFVSVCADVLETPVCERNLSDFEEENVDEQHQFHAVSIQGVLGVLIPPPPPARVRFQVKSCVICSGQNSTGAGFL